MADLTDQLPAESSSALADDVSLAQKAAFTGGALTACVMTAAAVMNRLHRADRIPPTQLPKAVDAPVGSIHIMEGEARYYYRQGNGTPIVLLHGINAAASSFELKPVFEHLVETTDRPIYALEWMGFGRSERPAMRYTPELYLRQLRRFLSEVAGGEADIVALSLGCEYAASVAATFPMLVRKVVLIAPTGLTTREEFSTWSRLLTGLAYKTGFFELFFHRLTRRESLARFYEQHVFPDGAVPPALIDYAYRSSHVQGAHRAPRHFIDGSLFLQQAARRAYRNMHVPTLLVPPTTSKGTIQNFDLLPDLLSANPSHMRAAPIGNSLLPHWETPTGFFNIVDLFLND